jgi:Holliday junction resolvase
MARDGDLRAIFRRRLTSFDFQSIETGSTGRGIPDMNYCHDGREGWIEAKQTQGWAVGLRPEQIGWLMRRARHGGRVWIAVRRKGDELWLIPGDRAAQLKSEGLKDIASEHWTNGPSRWDWDRIAYLLAPPKVSKTLKYVFLDGHDATL